MGHPYAVLSVSLHGHYSSKLIGLQFLLNEPLYRGMVGGDIHLAGKVDSHKESLLEYWIRNNGDSQNILISDHHAVCP